MPRCIESWLSLQSAHGTECSRMVKMMLEVLLNPRSSQEEAPVSGTKAAPLDHPAPDSRST